MSNILIIKHGSLGDIVQISGVIRDIREAHQDKKIFVLTTLPYVELLSRCPYIDATLIDRRLPRWNLIYLEKLRRLIRKFNFSHAYDLQNSSRTSFYRKYLFSVQNWSSTETALLKEQSKKDFDNESVLERFKVQLENSKIVTKHTLYPDFSWGRINVDKIVNKYFGKKFILLFPFCSPQLSHKQWPYFNELIQIVKTRHADLEVATAPGPHEMEMVKKVNSISITNNNKSLNIMELAGLISKSSFIISNDTGPAHMAAHLGKNGVVLFGHHTTAKKVSIETEKFKAISVKDLNDLTPSTVYSTIENYLKLIN
jgi:ADP-heptose:LPS heptosyltransferase